MADITDTSEDTVADRSRLRTPPPRPMRDSEGGDPGLTEIIELIFFAYRDFIADPDSILAEIGFGRAHHRVLHFVDRHPGLRVADLLDILKITKQSLAPVLKQLVDEGFIVQEAGRSDRRERLLYPTDAGRALSLRLEAPQQKRILAALAEAGPEGPEAVRAFLETMVNASDRNRVKDLIAGPRGRGDLE